jgi:hypothetical protein
MPTADNLQETITPRTLKTGETRREAAVENSKGLTLVAPSVVPDSVRLELTRLVVVYLGRPRTGRNDP